MRLRGLFAGAGFVMCCIGLVLLVRFAMVFSAQQRRGQMPAALSPLDGEIRKDLEKSTPPPTANLTDIPGNEPAPTYSAPTPSYTPPPPSYTPQTPNYRRPATPPVGARAGAVPVAVIGDWSQALEGESGERLKDLATRYQPK